MSGIFARLLKKISHVDIDGLEQQVESLNGQCGILRKNVAELEKNLASARQENLTLQKKLEQTNRDLENSYSEGARLSEEASSLRSEYDKLVSEKSTQARDLQSPVSGGGNRDELLQEELVVLKDKVASLQGELQKTRKELDQAQRENGVTGNELSSLRELHAKLISENGTLKQQVQLAADTSAEEFEHLQKEFALLQEEHSRLLATHAEENLKLRDMLAATQTENNELKEQMVRLEQNLTMLRREGAVMGDKITSLRERNLHLNNENKALQQSVREGGMLKHAEMERLQTELATLQAENSRLRTIEADEKIKWQTVCNELQGENKALQLKLSRTEQELETTLRTRTSLSDEVASLRDQNMCLANENKSLQQSVRQENDARKNEVDQLQNEVARLQNDLKSLQEKMVRTEQDLSAAQRECNGLADDVNLLREQNSRLTVENKSLLESLRKDGVARKSEESKGQPDYKPAEKTVTADRPEGMKEQVLRLCRKHKYVRVTLKPFGVQYLFESEHLHVQEKGFSATELVLLCRQEVLFDQVAGIEGLESPYWTVPGNLSDSELLEQAVCSYRPVRIANPDKTAKTDSANLYWMAYRQEQADGCVLPDKDMFVALLSGQCDSTKLMARMAGTEGVKCLPVEDVKILQVYDAFQTTSLGIEALKNGYQAALFKEELQLADMLYGMLPQPVRDEAELVSARAIHCVMVESYEEAMKLFCAYPQDYEVEKGVTWYAMNMENLETFVNAEISIPKFVHVLELLQAAGWKIA